MKFFIYFQYLTFINQFRIVKTPKITEILIMRKDDTPITTFVVFPTQSLQMTKQPAWLFLEKTKPLLYTTKKILESYYSNWISKVYKSIASFDSLEDAQIYALMHRDDPVMNTMHFNYWETSQPLVYEVELSENSNLTKYPLLSKEAPPTCGSFFWGNIDKIKKVQIPKQIVGRERYLYPEYREIPKNMLSKVVAAYDVNDHKYILDSDTTSLSTETVKNFYKDQCIFSFWTKESIETADNMNNLAQVLQNGEAINSNGASHKTLEKFPGLRQMGLS